MRKTNPAVTLVALSLSVVACTGPEGEESSAQASVDASVGAADRAPQVETLTLEPQRFTERIEVTGTTEAINDAVLSAQTAGTVQNLVPLGTEVKKGAVLAHLDPGLVDAQVRQARASVEASRASVSLAQESYDRQKPLYEGKIISALEFRKIRSDLASAKAQLAQAEAGLAQALKNLSYTQVVAPFDGVVESHSVKEGEQVVPGTQVLRLTDSRVMKIKAGVPERYAADIRVGREASIRFNAYGIKPRSEKLSFVSSVIDSRSRTFDVEVQLSNQDRILKPEMVARLVIAKQVIEDALFIPITAVIRDETGISVYIVIRTDGVVTAQLRRIELGAASGGKVVITSGLAAGDEVVVLGQNELTRGDIVQVTQRREARASSP